MLRQIFFILIAVGLAASLLGGLITLPYANLAYAESTPRPFGLRTNLLIETDVTPLVNAAQIMRLDWIAQEVQWKTIEPKPGQYNWAKLDALLNATRASKFRIMLSISGTPDWARAAGGNPAYDAPPADLNTFSRFITALAKRYDGLIGAYEIYPEANLATRWSTAEGISPERYTELLKAAYTAAHTVNSLNIVIGGSLAPIPTSADSKTAMDDLTFYKRMYKAGAAKYMDSLGVHVEGYNNPPQDFINANSTSLATYKNNSAFYFRHYETVRSLMLEHNDTRGLWITSAGWASSTEKIVGREYALDLTEEKQADYVVDAMKFAQTHPYITVLFINNFNYSTVVGNDPLAQYSLIRADWSARPVFLRLAQARQDTSALTFTGATASAPTQTHTLPNWRPRQRQVFGTQP